MNEQLYIREIIHQYKHPNQEELVSAIKQFKKAEDPKSIEKIFISVAPYITKLANKYGWRNNIDPLELINESYFGLIEAVKKFDENKGSTFLRYASFWLKNSIKKYCNDARRQLGETIVEYTKDKAICRALCERNLKDLRDSERCLETKEVWSINQPASEDGGLSLSDKLGYNSDPLKDIFNQEISKVITDALNSLNEKERKVIELRFGLKDNKEYALRDIAKRLKLSRERVRQIEEKAKKKLKIEAHLKDFLQDQEPSQQPYLSASFSWQ